MQKARWSTAVAAAALLALPVAGSAQSTQSTPQQNPPAQQQQPPSQSQQPPSSQSQQPPSQSQQPPTQSQQPPTQSQQPPSQSQQPPSQSQQPPAQSQQPTSQSAAGSPAQAGAVDATAAKTHLSEARDTLSQLTSLPQAAKLQGEARTQVSQVISNFNALITTQSDWRAAYAKLDANLTSLLGAESADANQPVGTSGSAGAAQLDPAIRAKLVEFRTHLSAFEKAAGGATPAASGDAHASAEAMPPSAPTPSTANPSNPDSPANPANPNVGSNGDQPRPAATTGVSPSSPTANMDASDRSRASSQVNGAANADAQKELDAISAILTRSKTGTLTKAQTAQLKKHVEALRSMLAR